MTYRHLLALALPLAVALPVSAAEWSDDAKTEFDSSLMAASLFWFPKSNSVVGSLCCVDS